VEKRKAALTAEMSQFARAETPLNDAEVYLELAREENQPEHEAEIDRLLTAAAEQIDALELTRVLSGENDPKSAIVNINAGAGGTESQDWAEMLLRMYLRYCDVQKWETQITDYQPGDEAGLKSATFLVEGLHAFGFLKAENGIHRLVRISPFDASKRRHTSFASVFVYPQVDDSIQIHIEEKDLRIDVYRASGAGGQKVNKTSSAVRITHLPTNIVVQCQNERSQHKNKDVAMKVLRARLHELEKRKQDDEKKQVESSKMRIDFGSQIRSYVLHPYKLVKDHRTGHEMGNANAVLDGNLHGFIKAWLLSGGTKTAAQTALADIDL
jgi:peptide chain release factor 2